jgi:hypothetical protein
VGCPNTDRRSVCCREQRDARREDESQEKKWM